MRACREGGCAEREGVLLIVTEGGCVDSDRGRVC